MGIPVPDKNMLREKLKERSTQSVHGNPNSSRSLIRANRNPLSQTQGRSPNQFSQKRNSNIDVQKPDVKKNNLVENNISENTTK
jgi:hypothetical protein